MTKNAAGFFVIEISDKRVRGGRLAISSRTRKAPEYRRRYAAVRVLIDAGEAEIVERLRAGTLHIADLARAVQAGDLDPLRTAGQAADLGLEAAWERLMQSVRARWKPATVKQYEVIGAQLIAQFGASTPLTAISSQQLRDWIYGPQATTGGRPWSHNSQQLRVALVGRLFNVVIRDEAEVAERTGARARVRVNPVRNVEVGGFRATRPEFLRPTEWRALAKATAGLPSHALVAVMCLAGLRIGEAANLRTGIDVELGERAVIRVQPREGEHEWSPKGYPRTLRSCRDVPLSTFPELRGILEAHVRDFAGPRYLFSAPGFDRPPSRYYLTGIVSEAFRAAGIRYGRTQDALTAHSLRHTFISWMVQKDVSFLKIERLAGTSVKMIVRVYGHLVSDDLTMAMGRLAEKAGEA